MTKRIEKNKKEEISKWDIITLIISLLFASMCGFGTYFINFVQGMNVLVAIFYACLVSSTTTFWLLIMIKNIE